MVISANISKTVEDIQFIQTQHTAPLHRHNTQAVITKLINSHFTCLQQSCLVAYLQ